MIYNPPPLDSIMWKTILKYKTEIGILMECGVNYTLNLTGLKLGSSFQKNCLSLAPPRQIDSLAYLD